jgi:cell division protease FtsH
VFLGRDLHEGRDYSEKTASLIDDEVAGILKDAQKRANEIIVTNREKLELIAQELIAKETIGQKEFADLMGGADPDVVKEDAEILPMPESPSVSPAPAVA